MVLEISFAVRLLLFSERKVCSSNLQNAFNVHNSSAANLHAAEHNNFIFFSSGHKTRAEKKCKATVDKTDDVSPTTLSFRATLGGPSRVTLSSGHAAWIKIETGDIWNRDYTKTSTMNHWESKNRIECASQPLSVRIGTQCSLGPNTEDGAFLGTR